MGHITVKATFYNAIDYIKWINAEITKDQVKLTEVNAPVNTSATYPTLPEDLIKDLKLASLGEAEGKIAGRKAEGKTQAIRASNNQNRRHNRWIPGNRQTQRHNTSN